MGFGDKYLPSCKAYLWGLVYLTEKIFSAIPQQPQQDNYLGAL